MIRRPPRSTRVRSSAASDVYKRQLGDWAKNVTASVVHVEGDPDHPINRGTLCSKGATLRDDINNPNRLTKPMVRRPGSNRWEEISWDDAIAGIARHVKTTRDACFVAKNAKG